MPKPLTARTIEAAKPGSSRREIPDPALAGLFLVVQPSGAKAFAYRYRFAGKPRKLTLGRVPVMTLAQARAAASDAAQAVEHGQDPGAAKIEAKRKRAADAQDDRDTFGALFYRYTRRKLSKLKAGDTVRGVLGKHVLPRWGERKVQTIARRDVIDLLDEIADTGRVVTANRVRAYLSAFFGWCVQREAIEVTPVMGTKPVTAETSRDRVLTDDEIRWLWTATGRMGQPFGPLVRLLLLTAQRRGEVGKMTDAEISGTTWHLSADRTKNKRAHDVPLSEPARDVLASVERIAGRERWTFTTNGSAPVSGFSNARARLARLMAEMRPRNAAKLSPFRTSPGTICAAPLPRA